MAALSGAAALGHELLWTRRLIDLLGASGASTGRVLGCFFLGLAVGAAWASRLSRRVARPWRAAAIAEAAVAVLALPALFLPALSDWIWPAMGAERLIGPAGGAAKLLVSGLVLIPPTIAMGAVLPLLASASLTGSRHLDRLGIWLYAANTIGGVAGLAATTIVALPALGSAGAMTAAMAVNVLVAACLARMDRGTRAAPSSPPGSGEWEAPGTIPNSTLAGTVAFLSGAGVLAAEVVAVELVMLVAPLSFYAPATVLAAVVLLLGVSSLLAPALLRRAGGAERLLPTLLAATAVALVVVPIVFVSLAALVGDLAGGPTLAGFLGRLGLLVLASVGLAVLPAGFVFPAALSLAEGDGADRGPSALGRLLALGGIGGLVGAEAAYELVLPAFGIHGGMTAVALFYAVAAIGVAAAVCRRAHAGVSAPLIRSVAATVVVLSLGLGWVRDLPSVNPHLDAEVVDQRFGREGAVAVIEGPAFGRAILLSNQYILGTTSGRWDQERQAHLPLLLHPDPRSVAFIGLATGITPGAALDHGRVRSITAVELSPLVARASAREFPAFNHGLAADPRARVVVEDGRTYLSAAPGRFDVIVGDLFLPWAPGEGRLFSVEHFESVRRSLRPGGVFCQWLPMYQLTPSQFELIAGTFLRAFPQAHLIRNGFGVRQPMLGLVGFRDGDLDWSIVARRCAECRAGGAVLDPVARHREAVGMLYLGHRDRRGGGAPVNTLGNLALELSAGRERIIGDPGRKYLHGGRWLRWLGRRLPTAGGEPGDEAARNRSPSELTRLGLLLSAWEMGRPADPDGSPPSRSPDGLSRRLPRCLIEDRAADWARWPASLLAAPPGPT